MWLGDLRLLCPQSATIRRCNASAMLAQGARMDDVQDVYKSLYLFIGEISRLRQCGGKTSLQRSASRMYREKAL